MQQQTRPRASTELQPSQLPGIKTLKPTSKTRLLQQTDNKPAELKKRTQAEIVASMFVPFVNRAWQLKH